MGNTLSCVCDGDGGLRLPTGPIGGLRPSCPDFTMVSVTDGSTVTLHDFLVRRGCHPGGTRPTVLQFYATWCEGSHRAAETLEQLSATESRVNFVHVCVDPELHAAQNAEEFHWRYELCRAGPHVHHFWLDHDNEQLAANDYRIDFSPHRVILGKDGQVAVRDCRQEWPELAVHL
jgi:thiol-disulfide isomerase/thioredoxin